MDEKILIKAKWILGALTIILGALGFYEAYKVALYILNMAPGSLATYSEGVRTLFYVMFILAIAFVIYDRLEAKIKSQRRQ